MNSTTTSNRQGSYRLFHKMISPRSWILIIVFIFVFFNMRGTSWAMTGKSQHQDLAGYVDLSVQTVANSENSQSFLYLPLLLRNYPKEPRPLGNVTLISGPTSCDGGECYEIEVSCPQISRPEQATIRLGDPTGTTYAGTILFATGWTGTYFWGGSGSANIISGNLPPEIAGLENALQSNRDILDNLQASGFRTVELAWQRNWFQAELGHPEGMANLACKPAAVVQWVFNYFHAQDKDHPFCATGHSNGASQIGYSISQYGLAHILSAVVFEGGPNWSRIDQACLHDDPLYSDLYGDPGARKSIDWGFGFPNDGSGPCANQDASYRTNFQEASLALGYWQYDYPKTMVSFVIGGEDTTTTAAQGIYFHDLLVQKNTPLISLEIVPGAPHFVTNTAEGAQAMENTLLNECRLR